MPDKLVYAHSMEVYGGDLYMNKSFLSGDHLESSELINEELRDPMSFYSEKVWGSDDLACGGAFFYAKVICGRNQPAGE